jgi:hypothetical protein
MAPLIAKTKLTLGYPLYACDFDPRDASRLVVGGGGGGSRTGVKNSIVSAESGIVVILMLILMGLVASGYLEPGPD